MHRIKRTGWLLGSLLLLAGCLAAQAAEKTGSPAKPAEKTEKTEKGKKAAGKDEDAAILPAPPRAEGEGPFKRLILRGVTLIDGTGAPAMGPVDIVIEKNRIAEVAPVGSPGAPPDPEHRLKAEPGDREMDLHGMYVLPGFVDMHGHIGGKEQGD